jgi:hypothetical protein
MPIDREMRDEIQQATRDAAAKFLKDLPANVTRRLDKAVARILGFDNRYGGDDWSIDHCNGRSSTVGDLISGEAHKAAQEATSKIITKKLIREIIKDRRPAILEDFKDRFIRSLDSAMYAAGEKAAKEYAEKLADKTLETIDLEFDICDPEVGNGDDLEQHLLELRVRDEMDLEAEEEEESAPPKKKVKKAKKK